MLQRITKGLYISEFGGYLRNYENREPLIGLNRDELEHLNGLTEGTIAQINALNNTRGSLINEDSLRIRYLNPDEEGYERTRGGKLVLSEDISKELELGDKIRINTNIEKVGTNWPAKVWKLKKPFRRLNE